MFLVVHCLCAISCHGVTHSDKGPPRCQERSNVGYDGWQANECSLETMIVGVTHCGWTGGNGSEHTDYTRINVITLSIVLCSVLYIEALLWIHATNVCVCVGGGGGVRKGTEET